MTLNEEERAELMKRSSQVQEMLSESFRQYKELEKSFKEKIKSLEQETFRNAAAPFFEELVKKYKKYPKIVKYLHDLQEDLLDACLPLLNMMRAILEFFALWRPAESNASLPG